MMKTAFRNALLCVLFLCSSPALAWDGFGVLMGTVIDEQSRQPIPGVPVYLFAHGTDRRLQSTVTTDENGFYRLPQLPPGIYSLAIYEVYDRKPYSGMVIVRLNRTYRMNVEVESYGGD